ncbi:hypothetical protein L0657_06775 [Dyadobacter sp. CY345]|uniref:hypothetical protein n=1 Tax=Dyadobacter sp. CY345 TaxID=2909335 RepID=UPI001F1A1275|nr:hypothetical protein [Dyadobacter sp. CY345]MCF2443654.1 hypothetical protein [Dyadobacter sp. CY345]
MNDKGFSETSVSLKLGEVDYQVNFGILARRRIEESHPGFNIIGTTMPDFEVIPFLIQNGIDPKLRQWKDEEEFLNLYENCKDENGLQLIPLAYQNALGFTNQRFDLWVQRATEMLNQAETQKN